MLLPLVCSTLSFLSLNIVAAASHDVSPSVREGPPVTTHRCVIPHKHLWEGANIVLAPCFYVALTLPQLSVS